MGYYNDAAREDNYYEVANALGQSRFPAMAHPEARIGHWLYEQFEQLCQKHHDVAGQLNLSVLSEAAIWKMLSTDAFAMCRSAVAKRAMWSAIAMSSKQFNDARIIQAIAPFLLESSQWRPKDALAKNIECFAGIYTPGKYERASLLTAAQNVGINPSADSFVREWLTHLTLAPGVLPVRKYRAQRGATTEANMQDNAVLWRNVVVPFMKRYPNDPLFGGRMFFHLPINPDEHEAKELLQSLDLPEQRQSVYVNMLCHRRPMPLVLGIWEEAQLGELTPEQKDLRLHLAMLHLDGYNARALADCVDPATVGMLDSLGTFTPENMAQLTYTRWFDRPRQTMELPSDWFDPETMDR